MRRLPRLLLATSALFAMQLAHAEEAPLHLQRWVADPAKSTLSFTATQEGAAFGGKFHTFNVSLELMANDAEAVLQSVNTVVKLGSVDTQYQDRDDYLAQEEWFHTKLWPEATFSTTQMIDHGDGSYTATGNLNLRGISKAIEVELLLIRESNNERGRLSGSATVERLDFGVGQGEWENTQWVGDDVNVEFDLYLLRAFE